MNLLLKSLFSKESTKREWIATRFGLQANQTLTYSHLAKIKVGIFRCRFHIPRSLSASSTGWNIADSPQEKNQHPNQQPNNKKTPTKIWNLLSHPSDPRQHCSLGSGVFEVCTWQSHLHLMSFRLLPFCCAKHLSQLSLIWWGHAVTPDPLGSKRNHLTKKKWGSLLPVGGHLIFADVQQVLQMTLLPG